VSEILLLRPEDAAVRLAMSRREIYRLMASGRLRSVKIGKARRISVRALEEFVEKAEQDGAQ
jgi:excisionase family DNA binding protein